MPLEQCRAQTAHVSRHKGGCGACANCSGFYLQVRVAGVNEYPRIFPSLVIVAGVEVALMQVATPYELGWLLIAVFAGSDVDQFPSLSAVSGQFPCTLEDSENCTCFAGGAAVWSEEATGGVMVATTTQRLFVLVAQLFKSTQDRVMKKRPEISLMTGLRTLQIVLGSVS